MQLADLAKTVQGATIQGDPRVEIRGVEHDSRHAAPGDLFVCLVGAKFDGHRFASDAVARGAAALCADLAHADKLPAGIPSLIVPNTRKALPPLATEVYGHPSHEMLLVGVTGTNGKTTTTRMMSAILRAAGHRTGTIGTLGAELMGEQMDSDRTTPEADQLQSLLAEMRGRGATAVAMEVSSHALDQGRTEGCEFDAAIFTNLTQDHLDYHGSLASYFEAKRILFTDYPARSKKKFVASVNLDDPRGFGLARDTDGRFVTYAVNPPGDVTARKIDLRADRLSFQAVTPNGTLDIEIGIGGAFQIYNALGAIAAAVGLGLPNEAIVNGLRTLEPVPGRFEPVATGRGFHVVVDYAHTPDGLENLLNAARRLDPQRVIVVFGCGGDRDRTKRPIMGRIAGCLADVAVVTSDNPRTEDPDFIISEILPGLSGAKAEVIVESDRRKAIDLALRKADSGSVVLIAGKGHEDYQEIHGVKHPFDDRLVARELLAGLPAEEAVT